MHKNPVLLFVLALFVSSCSLNIEKHHALYGERMDRWMVQDRTVRIFMDKEGLYYPEVVIRDKDLKKLNGSLRDWYHHNPAQLNSICRKYGVDSSGTDIDAIVDRLNDAIIKSHADALNTNLYHFSTLNVLIHGQRRKAYRAFPGFTRTSRVDNQKLAGSLTLGSYRDVLYLEVYWDGYFYGMGHNKNEMAKAFHEYATPSAINAGLGLRKLLTKIKKNRDINIVTYNLGALVGCQSLFNASGVVLSQPVAAENNISTPGVNKIGLHMIAPAIGSEVFSKYNSRNPDSSTGTDNYRTSLVYNEHDLALRKKYKGILLTYGQLSPEQSGNTSLGCNHNGDVGKMMSNVAPAQADTFNFSKKNGKKAKCQTLIGCYLKNDKIAEYADYIGNKKADEEAYAAAMAEKVKHLTGAAKRAYDAKMREEARKQLEAKRKADALQREKDRKIREIERKNAEKERMKEREQAAKERAAAEKQRQKEREAEAKQKAKEREEQVKQREAERRAAEKEKATERERAAAEKRAADKEKEMEKRRIEKEKAEAKRIADKAKAEERKRQEEERRAAEKQRNEERKAAEKERNNKKK